MTGMACTETELSGCARMGEEDMGYRISGGEVKLCFQLISNKTLRMSILPVEESVKDVFSTLDLDDRNWGEPSTVLSGGEGIQRLRVGDFQVSISENPLRVQVLREGRKIQELTVSEETGDIRFPVGERELYGLGHGYHEHPDRRGNSYDLRMNGQITGYHENYSAISPTPYVISAEGWALYFHQPWKGKIDLQGEEGRFIKYPPQYADVFFVDCRDPLDAPREYYAFTGLPPMPPKYAFGYQQSYRTLLHNGVNYVEKTAAWMREHKIPCDMLIYLGTGYCDNGWNTYNGNFEWHPEVFPEPEKTMKALHDMDYKISIHVTRCFTGLHGTIQDEDVSPLIYDHAANYWKRHVETIYTLAQNEAWWPDDADEVDMEQRLTRHRMYYEGSLELNPDVRPLQMQRNTFPGANRWGGIIWSGDVISEWETLKNQVPIGLNVALSCSPFWGTDTGGFFSTPEYDGELWMRWLEYSAFTPFFRGHGRSSFLHNTWGWSMFHSLDEIPLELNPSVLHDGPPADDILPDDRVEPHDRDVINLRYELMPYIYNMAHEACGGVPMMRPLWCRYPEDPRAAAIGSEYFFGSSLLVAPVTEKGASTWEVYLPEGEWYRYWTGEKYQGGTDVTADAPLGQIPLFVPAGGVLVKTPVVQSISKERPAGFEKITMEVYTGADAGYELYEDDGISLGYQRGEYSLTSLTWKDGEKKLSISGKSAMFGGIRREIEVRFMPEGRSETVSVVYESGI